MTFNAWQLTGVKNMDKSEDYKVDPRSIHVDQRKQDSRRDAWDRDLCLLTGRSLNRTLINVLKMQSQFLYLLCSM